MTAKEKQFIERQIELIDKKEDEDALNRYEMLLGMAGMSQEVKGYLLQACDVKRDMLNPLSPMVVNGDLDDID